MGAIIDTSEELLDELVCSDAIFSMLLEWIRLGRRSDQEKDLEILLLRHQLAILGRKQTKVARASCADKLILAALAAKLKDRTRRTIKDLSEVIRIIKPETVLNWHRELVRWKWTQRASKHPGRPRTPLAIEELVIRLASENDWGNGKIQGELLKLGHKLSEETIANILKRHSIPPMPERSSSLSWQKLMTHYKDQLIACDFFTVETLFLQTIYVLFFIEIGSRRVHFAGCTSHPKSKWVTQQARQLKWDLEDDEPSMRFLIRDRDTKFTGSFDTVFRSEGIDVICTPIRAPNANAYAERWIRSVREECLDKLPIINRAHLQRVMGEFIRYHNTACPHQGICQQIPIPKSIPDTDGPVSCRTVLGGIIHDYYRDVA